MPVTTTKNVLRDLKKGLLNYKPATPPPPLSKHKLVYKEL